MRLALKIIAVTAIAALCLSLQVVGQEASPKILTGPADWRYEYIPFPLDFAPDLPYTGFEELRFAPGMFDTLAADYFTYTFAISLTNQQPLSGKELSGFLTSYYKGLYAAVADAKKLLADTGAIAVSIQSTTGTPTTTQAFAIEVLWVDAFTNNKPVRLHMQLEQHHNPKTNSCQLLALVSPQAPGTAIWERLRAIQRTLE